MAKPSGVEGKKVIIGHARDIVGGIAANIMWSLDKIDLGKRTVVKNSHKYQILLHSILYKDNLELSQ